VPFVDPAVFKAAFSLPASERIRGRQQKAALKDAARAWLPDEIIEPSQGELRCAAPGLGVR
jgi:asparagine synthase (glutamine-hydrolysing)